MKETPAKGMGQAEENKVCLVDAAQCLRGELHSPHTHFTDDGRLHPVVGLCLPRRSLTVAWMPPYTHIAVDALVHPVA